VSMNSIVPEHLPVLAGFALCLVLALILIVGVSLVTFDIAVMPNDVDLCLCFNVQRCRIWACFRAFTQMGNELRGCGLEIVVRVYLSRYMNFRVLIVVYEHYFGNLQEPHFQGRGLDRRSKKSRRRLGGVKSVIGTHEVLSAVFPT
jgi:hypothetical protein